VADSFVSEIANFLNPQNVVRHPKQHPTKIQTNMTLPPDPTIFLAHCKAHKTPTQIQPCKDLKMPSHSPPTPADTTLLSGIKVFQQNNHISKKPTAY
jgi:hypothetical protein